MPESSSRTQITIACISAVSVLGAALIANYAKRTQVEPPPQSTGNSNNTGPAGADATKKSDAGASLGITPPPPQQQIQSVSPTPQLSKQEQVAAAASLDDSPDTAVILEALPGAEAPLTAGALTNFNVLVKYRLTSREAAALNLGLLQYDNTPSCQGAPNIPVDRSIPIYKGEHVTKMEVPYILGRTPKIVESGSIAYSLRFLGDHADSFKAINLPGYCYSFR